MMMKYKLTPYPHQIEGIDRGTKDNLGLFWEVGTGKTGATINILRYLYAQKGQVLKTLILSPLVTLYNWKEEFGIHSYMDTNNVHLLKGPSKKKMKVFEHFTANKEGMLIAPAVFVTNYESVLAKGLFDMFMEWRPDIIVLDEAHYIKNHKAKRSKALIKLGDMAKHKYILTGTPILNNVSDIFNLFRFLDGGETFGKSPYVFQNTYMMDENAGWANKQGHFPKLVARPEMYESLHNKIYTKCHRVVKSDVLKDLPPLIKTVRHVELSMEQRKAYKEMERDFIAFVQDRMATGEHKAVVAQLAVTKALRLQQICTGYATTDEGEDVYFKSNPRLDATRELLQEIIVDGAGSNKCILWCSFKANYVMLSRLCEELNIEYTMLTGEQNVEQKRESVEAFEKGTARVIIANRKAGGIGINLVSAGYSIIFSRNFSLEEEIQSEGRNYRGGSQRHAKVLKIDLAAKDTIDEKVLEALLNKKDISRQVIDLVKTRRK